MVDCGELAEAMVAVNLQWKSYRDAENWGDISRRIYEANRGQIDASVRIQLEKWTNGDYFMSGAVAGHVE